MARNFWKTVDLWKPPMFSAPKFTRPFFSSHSANRWSLDPEKAKAEKEKYYEWCKSKRRTDPEWTKRKQRFEREALAKTRQSWSEERHERYKEDLRGRMQKKYAEDPWFKLSQRINVLLRQSRWARECLPWKTHAPVLYDKKVEHICRSCLVTRHGGAKLWWRRHDGEQYECFACYFKSSESMPEGYEDCESIVEVRKRSKTLGHEEQRK